MDRSNNKDHQQLFFRLADMLKDMNYGSITLVVQDGKVIQIEKNEKHRIK